LRFHIKMVFSSKSYDYKQCRLVGVGWRFDSECGGKKEKGE
jgi:hypothetical protein